MQQESPFDHMNRILKKACDDNGHPITQPVYDDLTSELKRLGWKDTGDAQHENIKGFLDDFAKQNYLKGFCAAMDILKLRGDSCNCVDALTMATE